MTSNSSTSSKPGKARKPKAPHGVRPGSLAANRIAIAVLEVLAGQRTPTDAAAALGVSVPRYYQLETRAVNGLVAACEPPPKGKQPSPQTKIAALERQLAAAQREVSRQQSLVRAAHRSLGLKAAPAPNKSGRSGKSKQKAPARARRPTARALRAARTLQEKDREPPPAAVQPTVTDAVDSTSSTERTTS